MKFYFAAPFAYSPQLLPLKDTLEANKFHKITSTWLMIDPQYKSKNSMEAAGWAIIDLKDVDACDMLVLFNPEIYGHTPGRNIEFGYALARGKALAIVGKRHGVFQHLPQIHHFDTNRDFLDWVYMKEAAEYL